MTRPKPTCNPRELKALLGPAIGLALEDIAGLTVCVVTLDEDGSPTVAVISDGASWRDTVLTLAYATQTVIGGGK
jgi:hypothetical protein